MRATRSLSTNRAARSASTGLVALVLLLSGCSDSPEPGDGSDGEPLTVLTEEQATEALLSSDNLGSGFRESSSDDEDDSSLGCLDVVGENLEGEDELAETSVEAEYAVANDFELPALQLGVSSYDDLGALTDRFEELRDALDGCDSVSETSDGATIELDLEVDDQVYDNRVDEQFNLTADGTISASGLEFPFIFTITAARIENHVAFVGYSDLVADIGDAATTYVGAQVERLLTVLDGEEPSEELVTVSDPGDSTDLPTTE